MSSGNGSVALDLLSAGLVSYNTPTPPRRSETMDEWLTTARDRIAEQTGLPADQLAIDDATATELLELAGIAAHTSGARTNAPLLTFLTGVAVGRGAEFAAISAAIRALEDEAYEPQ
jgi:hypothetical protein